MPPVRVDASPASICRHSPTSRRASRAQGAHRQDDRFHQGTEAGADRWHGGQEITIKFPSGAERKFTGQVLLLNFCLPNFYFHYTTAYDILRNCGCRGRQTRLYGHAGHVVSRGGTEAGRYAAAGGIGISRSGHYL